jgi:glucose-1-phosphate cytidylyltransferase
LEILARTKKLAAFRHEGFWQSLDTLRDKNVLENLWNSVNPPWKLWTGD